MKFGQTPCATESSTLCSYSLGWFTNWCKKPLDPLCEATNGRIHTPQRVIETAQEVSKSFGISYQMAFPLAGLAFAFLAWRQFRSKNPNLTSEELMKKIITENFGTLAQPIIDRLDKLIKILNNELKADVLKEQPFLNQPGSLFAEMVAAGTESKMNKLMPQLGSIMLSPETAAIVTDSAQKAGRTTTGTEEATIAGLQESAFTDALDNVLKGLIEAAKAALIPQLKPIAIKPL